MADDQDLPPRSSEDDEKGEGEGERKRLFERAIPEVFKRVVERAVVTGVHRLAEGPEGLRNLMGDMKLPKEVLNYIYTQIDDTKGDLYRVVAKEIRDVFERMQFADEIAKVLTKLSFEIRTEIRFIPNDAGQGAQRKGEGEEGEGEGETGEAGETSAPKSATGLPKPEVSTQVTVKDRSKDARRDRRRREDT